MASLISDSSVSRVLRRPQIYIVTSLGFLRVSKATKMMCIFKPLVKGCKFSIPSLCHILEYIRWPDAICQLEEVSPIVLRNRGLMRTV